MITILQIEQTEAELFRMMQTYGSTLTGMCTLRLYDPHLAQNIVQETFLKAWIRCAVARAKRYGCSALLSTSAGAFGADHTL